MAGPSDRAPEGAGSLGSAATPAWDNAGAEKQLRIVAVGRKDWLFAGSLE